MKIYENLQMAQKLLKQKPRTRNNLFLQVANAISMTQMMVYTGV